MFLRFFRSSFATQYFAIGILAILLWLPAFIQPVRMPSPSPEAPVYNLLFCLLADSPRLQVLFGFLAMLFSAFTCNFIFSENDIVSKNSSLAAFLFVIFSSWYPELLTLNPASLTVIFLLISFRAIYISYNRVESLDLTYTAGFFTGVATLIYPSSFLFLLFLWISLIIIRSSDWRSFISSIIGILTPFLFISVYYFWFDKLPVKASLYMDNFRNLHLPSLQDDLLFSILLIIVLLVFLFSLVSSYNHLQEKTIEGRRKNLILYWYSFFAALTCIIPGLSLKYIMLLLAVPISGFLSSYLLRLRKNRWQEIHLIVFIMFVLAINYYRLFAMG